MLRAKKYAKSKKPLMESEEKRTAGGEVEETEKNQQVNPNCFPWNQNRSLQQKSEKVKHDCDWESFSEIKSYQ